MFVFPIPKDQGHFMLLAQNQQKSFVFSLYLLPLDFHLPGRFQKKPFDSEPLFRGHLL
jgi:hypothetical protein